MKKIIVSLITLTLITYAFTGISSGAPKELVLGVNTMLSGPAASIGLANQRAFDHAAELINEKGFEVQGEKYILKPIYFDHKYVPAESVMNLEKMLAQGIKFIFSTGSGASVPLVEKTTAAKIFQISAASGSDHLTSPKYPYSFRAFPTNESAFAMYPWLVKAYPQIKTAGHINPSDEAGFTESETRMRCAKNVGYTNVISEYYKRGATDYYPVATKVVAANPDFIDFGGTIGRDQALAVKALRELGYKGMIGIGYSDPEAFVRIAGAEAAEGTILFNTITEATTPKQKELEEWYIKKYGPPMLNMVYEMWDVPFIFIEAVKKANSLDPEKISEALRTITWPSVHGEMYASLESIYGIKSSFVRPAPMGIIKNGKPVHITTVPYPTEEVVKKLNTK